MLIVNVDIKVKPDMIDQFIEVTIKNASESIKEPGITRFDFMQNRDRPDHFILVEVYKDEKAPLDHKNTIHYKNWKETVTNMMAQPRKSVKYINIFPEESSW